MSELPRIAIRLGRRVAALAASASLCAAGVAGAETVRVAVAANFVRPMSELAAAFESATDHRVLVSPGSSGKLLAQIEQGAPFDLFLSADRERVERLVESGRAVAGSDWVYVRGRLVLWSADAERVDSDGAVLHDGDFHHLAIANPRLAPYGRAAREALETLGLWQRHQPRLVRGESVGQAFQFVASGAAELGFVARSQLPDGGASGSAWEVPARLHRPIEQAAVLLTEIGAAVELRDYLRGAAAAEIVRRHGYEVP